MRRQQIRLLPLFLLGCLVLLSSQKVIGAFRFGGVGARHRNKSSISNGSITATAASDTDESYPGHMRDIPGVPYLVETLGKELYQVVNKPKYKFYLYMTIGKLPDETSFVIALNMLCNLLYCLVTFAGFCLLPRNFMLVGTAVTILVGPALVLILLGSVVLVLVAFTLYPIVSVATLWGLFFMTSQAAQVLGRAMGLDQDKDGDVDWMDVLCYLGQTRVGRALRLDVLHQTWHESTLDPFQAIHKYRYAPCSRCYCTDSSLRHA